MIRESDCEKVKKKLNLLGSEGVNAMKKIIAMMLLICMVWGMAVANAEDYSSMSTDELNQTVGALQNELISRQLENGGKILVLDDYGVKIFFDGFSESSAMGSVIRFIVMNNSEETFPLVVAVEELYIENWEVLRNGYVQTLEPGKNGVGEPMMDWSKCLTADQDSASKIDVKFSFSLDKGDFEWEWVHDTDLVTFYVKGDKQ